MLLSITIWNRPLVQYQLPTQLTTTIRSRPPYSTAVQYALIGVYNKLLHPPTFSSLISTFISIICVLLSSFVLLADSFTSGI